MIKRALRQMLQKKITSKIKKQKQKILDKNTTVNDSQANDVYIVEFPKSGVTWLSTILGNMALKASGRNESVTFFTSNFYVPDIHVTRHVGELPYTTPPVRFIKSHAKFNKNYAFLIYLARHPLPVMKSYYRFLNELHQNPYRSFDKFCRSKKYGIPAWKSHVESWLTGLPTAQRIHLCRYEDLIKDAKSEVKKISENFGWNIEFDLIDKAVSDSRLDKMKKTEELYRSHNPRYSINFVGGGDNFFVSERTIDYIKNETSSCLALLGYE